VIGRYYKKPPHDRTHHSVPHTHTHARPHAARDTRAHDTTHSDLTTPHGNDGCSVRAAMVRVARNVPDRGLLYRARLRPAHHRSPLVEQVSRYAQHNQTAGALGTHPTDVPPRARPMSGPLQESTWADCTRSWACCCCCAPSPSPS
jgi:hypothetical protein